MAREFFGGWETGSFGAEGFTTNGGSIVESSADSHKDVNDNGGSFYYRGGTFTVPIYYQQNDHVRNLNEAWDRFHVFFEPGSESWDTTQWIFAQEGTALFAVGIRPSDRAIQLFRGDVATGTLLSTSIGGLVPQNRWVNIEIHYYCHATNGFCRVYVDDDGTYVTPAASYTGDTSAIAPIGFNSCGIRAGRDVRIDEYARNSISLLYDTGTGTAPVAGQTITGGTSGATAVITLVEGNATSGRLILEQWNGTEFVNNEVLTSATLTALVHDPYLINGFELNSFGVGAGFVIACRPNGSGNYSQLDGSDGNSVDNYALVNSAPPDIGTYVFSNTPNELDTYTLTDVPDTAGRINAVASWAYAAFDGTGVTKSQHVLRIGATDYSTPDMDLASSYAAQWKVWNTNPADSSRWTRLVINGTEAGFKVRA